LRSRITIKNHSAEAVSDIEKALAYRNTRALQTGFNYLSMR